jgi:hypothetical protein
MVNLKMGINLGFHMYLLGSSYRHFKTKMLLLMTHFPTITDQYFTVLLFVYETL